MRPGQEPRHRVHGVPFGQGERARAMLEAQIGHQLGIGSARGEPLHPELAGELVHQIERPAPHRAGRAEEDQPLHWSPRMCAAQ